MRKLLIIAFCAAVLFSASCIQTGGSNGSGSGPVKEITDSTFASDISSGVVLVEFWAPW